MKALVIAPEPFFSPRGTPFSVYYRTLVTAELGVSVDLLTYGEGRNVDIPNVRIIRIPRFGFLGPVKIGPSWKKLFLDQFLILWTIGLLLRERYDFVHCHEETVFFCRFLKPIFRFKMIYDMHSSLPQQLSNFKVTQSRLLIGTFQALEDSALEAADAVITICPTLAEHALARMPDAKRHQLIENSIFDTVRLADDVEQPDRIETEPLPPAPRPLVIYAGTFEPYQGLDILIEGFARAHREQPSAFLMMIGGSRDQVEYYRDLAYRAGLEGHCQFTGRLPQAQVKRLLKDAAVLTSPRVEGTNTPLKIYEQLASGIPLVATRILSHTQVLDEEVCVLVEPDAESMGRGLIAALTDQDRRRKVVQSAQKLFERKYSRRAYTDKMRRLFEVID
jgi:glycosyltransferase involved in cell wall biosynthesis